MKIAFNIIIFFITMIFSCSSTKNESIKNIVNISDKEYNRDSIFIKYTIHKFIENKYRGYNFLDCKNSKVFIDTILYSPDKLKLFSLIIVEETKTEITQPFNGMAIVAYREDTNSIWKVYPITKFNVSWSNFKGAKNVIRRSYFTELKGMKDNQGNKFRCNLGDNKFWNDLFYKKGYDIDSLYYFQTELNKQTPTLKRKKDGIIPYLEIDYPQEIRKMFTINYSSIDE
jgi:hypothetical protein